MEFGIIVKLEALNTNDRTKGVVGFSGGGGGLSFWEGCRLLFVGFQPVLEPTQLGQKRKYFVGVGSRVLFCGCCLSLLFSSLLILHN